MKKPYYTFLFIGLLTALAPGLASASVDSSTPAYHSADAAPEIINGYYQASDQTVQSKLIVNGATHIDHSTFTKAIKVNGHLFAQHSQFADIDVNGKLDCTNCDVHKDITLHGAGSVLDNTKAHSITITANPNSSPTLILKGDTTISGNITFKPSGTIKKEGNVTIKGKVINEVASN